jgi:hypothetical protein
MELGELSPATGAALVVAGLLSVVPFPLGALTLLHSSKNQAPPLGSSGLRDGLNIHKDFAQQGCVRT